MRKVVTIQMIQIHYKGGIPGPGYCGGPFAPTIISTVSDPEYANVGEAYTYTVMATGYLTPTYSLNINPTGMIIDSNSGVISWTPTTTQSEIVTVEVSNSAGDDT